MREELIEALTMLAMGRKDCVEKVADLIIKAGTRTEVTQPEAAYPKSKKVKEQAAE